MYKIGADLKNVAMEILLVIVCDLVRLVLIYNKEIVVLNVVKLTANEEAFATRKAEKHLTAIVNMYIGIGIVPIRLWLSYGYILAQCLVIQPYSM